MKILIIILFLLIQIVINNKINIEYGDNINGKIQNRINNIFSRYQIKQKVLLSFGNTIISNRYINNTELQQLGSEGIVFDYNKKRIHNQE
jgi:hypothetical protein